MRNGPHEPSLAAEHPVLALLFAALVALAGCAEVKETPAAGPPPPALATPPVTANNTVEEPTLTAHTLDADNCVSATIILPVEPAVAAPLLPAGFHPRDAAGLIDVPAPSGKAAFAIIWLTCHNTTAEAEPVGWGALSVFVDQPLGPRDARDRDFYVVASWLTWPGFEAWLGAAGVNITGRAMPLLDVTSTPVRMPSNVAVPDPGPTTADLRVSDEETAAMSATFAGSTGYRLDGQPFRYWHHTTDHLAVFEVTAQRDGTGGGATCTYGQNAVFTQFTAEASCGQDGALGWAMGASSIKASVQAVPFEAG